MSSTSSRRFFFSSSAFRWTALRWRFVCTELTGLLSSNKALLHISFQLLKRHRKFVWNWKRLLHDKFTKLGAFFSSSCFCLIASNLACLGRYFDSGFDLISRNLNLAWRFMKTFITTWSHVAKKLFFMLQALLFLATPRYSRPTPMAFGQTASTPYHRTAATLRAAASASSRWRWAFSTSSSFLPICQRIDGTIKHPIAKPNTHIHCTLWSPAQGRSYLQRKECATCIQSITYRWPCGHKLGLYLSIYIYIYCNHSGGDRRCFLRSFECLSQLQFIQRAWTNFDSHWAANALHQSGHLRHLRFETARKLWMKKQVNLYKSHVASCNVQMHIFKTLDSEQLTPGPRLSSFARFSRAAFSSSFRLGHKHRHPKKGGLVEGLLA